MKPSANPSSTIELYRIIFMSPLMGRRSTIPQTPQRNCINAGFMEQCRSVATSQGTALSVAKDP